MLENEPRPVKGVRAMHAEQINRVSTAALVILSVTALLTVLAATVAVLLSGQIPPPEPDEGTGAHVFQLSIAALLPVGLLFLLTADWTTPSRVMRRLVVPAIAVVAAFALLYYFEHYLHRA
jgi:hypothetical protein